MALEIFRLVGSVFVDTDKAEQSLKKTDKEAGSLGKTLLDGAKKIGKFAAGLGAAAGAAGAAMVAIAENTREYRTEMGKLEAAYTVVGHSHEAAMKTYKALNGILGDTGQAVEAANHLAELAENEEDMATWTKICTGVFANFGASIPIESLTEAANETAKTGALTGALADALNWVGVNEEEFQKALDKCTSAQERQALITETMNDLYSEAADIYRETNAEVIAANEAQEKWNAAMATVGGAIEPFVTAGKSLLADVLTQMTPLLTNAAEFLIPLLTEAIVIVTGWVDNLADRLSNAGSIFEMVMLYAQTLFNDAMTLVMDIWTTIGQPVWDSITGAVQLVAGYFEEKMPAIQAFVRTAFTDIQMLWQNNLLPALTAIGNFIQNVLAPTFVWVFDNVIRPVVDSAFTTIKQLWEGTLKPVFQGILDFITGVFTLNFEKAFSGLVQAVNGIWSGLGHVVRGPLNAVIDVVNNFIGGLNQLKIPDWVPGVGGRGINIPSIPHLEEGGILAKGQIGLLEGHGAEAVVPLDKNEKWTKAVARDMDSAIGGNSNAVLFQILDLLTQLVADLPEYIAEGLDQTSLTLNKREVARIVKAVT